MGADFEDNPNLQTAPSGNVETPAVPFQPAVAPQAAIPAQPAVQMTPELKRAKLLEILMGQNPYASPVAKLMYESLEKQNTGPLAEYRLAQEQGYKGTMKDYQIEQAQAKRSITNVNMPAGAPIAVMRNGKQVFVQMGKDGKYVEVEGISPVPTQTPLAQELADAGITPDNPKFKELATAFINKKLTQVVAPSSSVTDPTGKTTQAAPPPAAGTINVMIDGKLTAMPIAEAEAINARFKGAETRSVEGARSEFEFVSVPDPKGGGGQVLMPKSQIAAQAAGGTPVISEIDKKAQQGISVIELAEKAKGLLPQASSGALSTLATIATDAAGYATNKSAADASLKVIAAGLTSNVPRFEGPQGVLDVQLYKQAAADVGNPLVPYKNRLAALNTVIELNKKYLPVGAAPSGSVRRITPRTGQQ
jgi:hypothetical protein